MIVVVAAEEDPIVAVAVAAAVEHPMAVGVVAVPIDLEEDPIAGSGEGTADIAVEGIADTVLGEDSLEVGVGSPGLGSPDSGILVAVARSHPQ